MRRLLHGITVALLLLPATLFGAQQAQKLFRVGWLCSESTTQGLKVFVKALKARGYDEGRNIQIEQRYAYGNPERLQELADELVRSKVGVIVACDSRAIAPARKATAAIPIVMAVSGDPVKAGHVASLARPGGNVTGFTVGAPELGGKRVELLRELLPNLLRLAVLGTSQNVGESREIKRTADALGIALISLDVSGPEELAAAFSLAAAKRAEALIVMASPALNFHSRRIVDLATQAYVPTIYPTSFYVRHGGLISYSADVWICSGDRPNTWTRFSRARSRRTSRCSNPRRSSLSST